MKSMQDIVGNAKDRIAAFDGKNTMENSVNWCRNRAARIVVVTALIAFVLVLAGFGLSGGDGQADSSVLAESDSGLDGSSYSGIAGVSSVLNGYELAYADQMDLLVVEDQDVIVVGSTYTEANDDAEDASDAEAGDADASAGAAETESDTEAADNAAAGDTGAEDESTEAASESEEAGSETETSEQELTEEEQEWLQYLMADVDEYLYIRAEASEDSEAVGKLYKGDRAVIEGTSGEWTKISSGSVEGYVMTEYCVTGTEALAYMKENCTLIATVISNKSLRVRKEQSTSSAVLKMVSKGTVLTVDTATETGDDWVAVLIDGKTYYVCADYVEVSYDIGEAISIEEEKAAEEAAKAAEEAAAAAAEASSSSTSSNSYDADTDEVTLLAALIQCEAGGESYKCQVSVGEVVMNRVASGSFPNSITKVIYQSGQFGPVSNGSLAKRLSKTISSTAYKAAQEAIAGSNYTDGCLYFNDIYHTSHSGLQIGAMIFW